MSDTPDLHIAYLPALARPNTTWKGWIKNRLERGFLHQDGFFRASLHAAFNVTEMGWKTVMRDPARLNDFDAVFVNQKCIPLAIGASAHDLAFIKHCDKPKILVASNARSHDLPGNDLMDMFDLVYKREPYKDRDIYNISAANKDKIHATMLSCPLVKVKSKKQLNNYNTKRIGYNNVSQHFSCDVFFNGGSTSKARLEMIMGLHDCTDLETDLTLQNRMHAPLDGAPVEGPRISLQRYISKTRESRINLAPPGIGPFTYRHLEILCLAGFCLSHREISKLELPIPLKEGVHYAGFEGTEDLIEKCRYYKDHEKERQGIALAGRKIFEDYYDFKRHGSDIRKTLQKRFGL